VSIIFKDHIEILYLRLYLQTVPPPPKPVGRITSYHNLQQNISQLVKFSGLIEVFSALKPTFHSQILNLPPHRKRNPYLNLDLDLDLILILILILNLNLNLNLNLILILILMRRLKFNRKTFSYLQSSYCSRPSLGTQQQLMLKLPSRREPH
jgi:hypothetical protein